MSIARAALTDDTLSASDTDLPAGMFMDFGNIKSDAGSKIALDLAVEVPEALWVEFAAENTIYEVLPGNRDAESVDFGILDEAGQ